MAYAEYLKGTENRIYCLMSDGELQEGSTWEAVRMAAPVHLKLDNLIVFIDANGYGGMERIYPDIDVIAQQFRANGWGACQAEGHNQDHIRFCLSVRDDGRPCAVVAKTVKGQGASFMVDSPIWHYKSPSNAEYNIALAEIG